MSDTKETDAEKAVMILKGTIYTFLAGYQNRKTPTIKTSEDQTVYTQTGEYLSCCDSFAQAVLFLLTFDRLTPSDVERAALRGPGGSERQGLGGVGVPVKEHEMQMFPECSV